MVGFVTTKVCHDPDVGFRAEDTRMLRLCASIITLFTRIADLKKIPRRVMGIQRINLETLKTVEYIG